MNLSIEINDEELSEIIEKGIKNLSDETITEIAKGAVSNFLSDKQTIASLAFQRINYSPYNRVIDYDSPRQWFVDLIKSSFSEDEVKEYRQKLLKTLDEEKDQIVLKAISRAFAKALVTEDFRNEVYNVLCR